MLKNIILRKSKMLHNAISKLMVHVIFNLIQIPDSCGAFKYLMNAPKQCLSLVETYGMEGLEIRTQFLLFYVT